MMRSSNKLDIEKMKQCHRTKDMINLLLFFPQANPIKELFIVESVEDYENNYEELKNILSKLLKMEDELLTSGFSEFAISGHTEGKKFTPWQMFDKGRYIINK